MKYLFNSILFVVFSGGALVAQDYATSSEHDRARRLDVPSFTEQITELIVENYEQFTVEWSSNDKGYTSEAIYLSKKLVVNADGELEAIDVEIQVLNPSPMNDWFVKRWIRNGLLKPVKFMGEHKKKLKFTPKQTRKIVKALDDEFELLEKTILQSREDYRPIVH